MTTTSTFLSKALLTLSIVTASFTTAIANDSNSIISSSIIADPTDNLSSISVFEAIVIDNRSINLNWVTKSEDNNIHFEVERSTDNTNFKTVAIVLDGFTTDIDQKSYKFKENKTSLNGATHAYYRLKQVQSNGEVKFSKTVIVNF